MKNFKAKERLKELCSFEYKVECDICKEEKDCLAIDTSNGLGALVCLDCLQYEEEK